MTHAHDRLLELASKATPGPWTIARDEDGKPYEMLGMFKGNVPDKVIECRWGSATERGANDYAYIAACDPQTISSLILENRRLRNALQMLVDEQVSYVTVNNLGDPFHNQAMKVARAALTPEAKP